MLNTNISKKTIIEREQYVEESGYKERDQKETADDTERKARCETGQKGEQIEQTQCHWGA
jgi:hypothetical protein